MRRIVVVFLMALAQSTQGQSIDAAQLPGIWHGEGRYYEVKLLRATDPPAFVLTIAPDLTLSGTVGEARFAAERPIAFGKRLHYQLLLDRPVGPGALLQHKDHLIILIAAVDQDSLAGDFHLKSRFGFDFNMHPGSLEAVRVGND
jgi:hypothetical protein